MGEKGFTLIEMLLVVAIIGFLVAILLPSVGGVGEGAKMRAAKADLRTLKSAIEVYYIAFGVYPPEGGSPGAWGTSASYIISPAGSPAPEIYSRFIDSFPADPYELTGVGDKDTYNYALSASGKFYIISSDKGPAVAPSVPFDDLADASGAELYVSNCKTVSP